MKLMFLILAFLISCSSAIETKKAANLYSGQSITYKRSMFEHWVDKDGDCQDERTETLIRHNIGQLVFKDKKECFVLSGKWVDPYSGKTFTKASDLDIDHVVTLKHSFEMGASEWSKEKRKDFANDPENLIPVWKKLNRQKGAKGPEEWLPPNKAFQCEYVSKWVRIKNKYGLTASGRTIASVNSIMSVCGK